MSTATPRRRGAASSNTENPATESADGSAVANSTSVASRVGGKFEFSPLLDLGAPVIVRKGGPGKPLNYPVDGMAVNGAILVATADEKIARNAVSQANRRYSEETGEMRAHGKNEDGNPRMVAQRRHTRHYMVAFLDEKQLAKVPAELLEKFGPKPLAIFRTA